MRTDRHFVFAVFSLPGSRNIYLAKAKERNGRIFLKPIGGVMAPGANAQTFISRLFCRDFGSDCQVMIKSQRGWRERPWGYCTAYHFEIINPDKKAALMLLEGRFYDLLDKQITLTDTAKLVLQMLNL